jgi:hypothetical protein
VNDGAIGNASLHNFQSRLWLKHTVMAQSTNAHLGVITGLQNALDEIATNFARGARDQYVLHV